MKKWGILVIGILLISIISVSLVTAGLLDEIFSKIIGRVVDEGEIDDGAVEEIEPEQEIPEPEDPETELEQEIPEPEDPETEFESPNVPPEEEPPEEEICGDGICQEGEVCDIDCCEQFCTLYCPNGAIEGTCGCECIETEPKPPEPPRDYWECEEGEKRYYTCPDGTKVPNCECENNMWVCEIFKDENCFNDEPEPETCAGEIKITFNKGSYKLGDDVKIIIETFDSQGNHLPNYAFYGQMYDDRWHTPDLQKTDNKGYFIQTGTAEKPAGGVTEVTFKVYTKEIGSCNSIEDIVKVKFEPGDCGIGECMPETGCKDKVRMCGGKCTPCPEDDEKGEIFYPCSGCELEGKCYPYGYRKDGSYCLDENNEFIGQLADNEKCENNFECKTNICIDGKCISSNIWNKFLAWFKKLFGGGEDERGPGPGPEICSEVLIEEDIGDYGYSKILYDIKEAQVPIYSEDGEEEEIIKCCAAQYLSQDGIENMGVVCPFDNRGELENSIKWILIKNDNLVLGEYTGEIVLNDRDKVIAWTSNTYIVATGAGATMLVDGNIASAYLNKYTNDLGEIDLSDVPPPSPPNSIELCREITDSEKQADCYIDVAMSKSDFEICEYIDEIEKRDKCYINVAEHTGDDGICENVVDDSLREKCYFWVAGETGKDNTCAGISDVSLQARCYAGVAEQTGDASHCARMTDSNIADKCYRDVGIQTNNRSLCEKIVGDEAKQKCLDNTS